MRHPSPLRLLIWLVTCSLLVSPALAGAQVTNSATLELVLGEYAFTPAAPSAPVGPVRLRLHNAGLRRHNLVLFADGVEHGPQIVLPGETIVWDAPVSRPGRYEFWCSEYRHLEKGMGGVLTLTEEPQG